MRIKRLFTERGKSPYERIAFRTTASEIRNPDGSLVFRLESFEVPASWSQVAADVLAQKYFRKAGVPARLKPVAEDKLPSWLWRKVADEEALQALPKDKRLAGESDARQVFDRLAGTWTYWGWKGGYFDSEEDASAYHDEMRYMLAAQMAAPESAPVVQHRPPLGLRHRRAVAGPLLRRLRDAASWCARSRPTSTRSRTPASSSRSDDDLVNEGGIMDLWVREARLFKYGSGTGTNFSKLRGDGETALRRRALLRHDELPQDRRPRRRRHQVGRHHAARRQDGRPSTSITRTSRNSSTGRSIEEQKVAALVAGSKLCSKHLNAIMHACHNCEGEGNACFDRKLNPALSAPCLPTRNGD